MRCRVGPAVLLVAALAACVGTVRASSDERDVSGDGAVRARLPDTARAESPESHTAAADGETCRVDGPCVPCKPVDKGEQYCAGSGFKQEIVCEKTSGSGVKESYRAYQTCTNGDEPSFIAFVVFETICAGLLVASLLFVRRSKAGGSGSAYAPVRA